VRGECLRACVNLRGCVEAGSAGTGGAAVGAVPAASVQAASHTQRPPLPPSSKPALASELAMVRPGPAGAPAARAPADAPGVGPRRPLPTPQLPSKPRPESALDVERSDPTAGKPPRAARGRATWPAELGLFSVAILIGLILACVCASRGINHVRMGGGEWGGGLPTAASPRRPTPAASQVAAIDRAASAVTGSTGSFDPVRALAVVCAVLGPLLALAALVASSFLARAARGVSATTPSRASALLTLPVLAALWSAVMLAAVVGLLAYSSALDTATGSATKLFDKARTLVDGGAAGTVRAVDTLGGALPFGKGIINSLLGSGTSGAGAQAALQKEVQQYSKVMGLSPEATAALAATNACPKSCLDVSFIPYNKNPCICDAAAILVAASRSKLAVAAFKAAVPGAAILVLAHTALAARAGVWAGAAGAH